MMDVCRLLKTSVHIMNKWFKVVIATAECRPDNNLAVQTVRPAVHNCSTAQLQNSTALYKPGDPGWLNCYQVIRPSVNWRCWVPTQGNNISIPAHTTHWPAAGLSRQQSRLHTMVWPASSAFKQSPPQPAAGARGAAL